MNLRNLCGAVLLAGAVSCAGIGDVDIQFDMTKDIAVDNNGTTTTVNSVVPVDLTQYSDVQAHKANIKALHFQSIDVKVTALTTPGGTNAATTVQGSLYLRPDGATTNANDVKVGDIPSPGLSITVGQSFHIAGSTALDTFLFNALQGTGKFSAVVAGSTTPANAAAHVMLNGTIHASLTYSTGGK